MGILAPDDSGDDSARSEASQGTEKCEESPVQEARLDETPRHAVKSRDLNSPSAGVTPGPQDPRIEFSPFGGEGGGDGDASARRTVKNTAKAFVRGITVEHPEFNPSGGKVRPFSAGSRSRNGDKENIENFNTNDTFGELAIVTGTLRPDTAPAATASVTNSEQKEQSLKLRKPKI